MRTKMYALVLACAIVLIGWVCWPTYAQRQRPLRVTWEYKVVSAGYVENGGYKTVDLNELGAQGWELVAVREIISISQGAGGSNNNPIYDLKRLR